MPKSLTEIQSHLDAGQNITRDAILMNFAAGNVGFWNGFGPWDWNGVTYHGCGKYLSGQDVTQVTNGSPVPIVITLSGLPSDALSDSEIGEIEESGYKGRFIHIYKWHFHPTTRALIKVRKTAMGRMDTIEHKIAIGGGYTIELRGESLAMDQKRTLYRMRTNEDQHTFVDEDDDFWEHATSVGKKQIDWGARAEKLRTGRRNIPARR